jgi:hypothetical protein
VAGGREGGFSFGVFPRTGIGAVDGVDGAFSWTGIDTGGVSGGFWFGVLSWTGIGVVGGGDDRLLFEVLSRAIGAVPNLWKYKLQVVDSFRR